MNNKKIIVLAVNAGVLSIALVAMAAVQLSVTQQKIKTLKATVTYQDIIVALAPHPDIRVVTLWDIPNEAEIFSGYMKVVSAFNQNGGQPADGALRIYSETGYTLDDSTLEHATIPGVDLRTPGITQGYFAQTFLANGAKKLILVVNANEDLSLLTDGALEIIVNYIEH